MKREYENILPIIAVSGGPDSVYLVHRSVKKRPLPLLAHYNHGSRGKASDGDQKFVERLAEALNVPVAVCRSAGATVPSS